MKVLVVADSEDNIKTISCFFEQHNYDIIIYRWLLKALDNVEEILPQVIVVSAVDYPRHWKTFVQYVHGALTSNCQPIIILIADSSFPDSEKEKAACLGVRCVIRGLSLDKLKQIEDFLPIISSSAQMQKRNYTVVTPITAEEKYFTDNKKDIAIDKQNGAISNDAIDHGLRFIFKNPKTGVLANGIITAVKKPLLFFKPDSEKDIAGIRLGLIIPECKIQTGTGFSIIKVQVQSTVFPIIKLCIVK